MTPIEIIRAVNGKALTVRAALQIIRHQKKIRKIAEAAKQVADQMGVTSQDAFDAILNTEAPLPPKHHYCRVPIKPLPPKIAVLYEHIRQELG